MITEQRTFPENCMLSNTRSLSTDQLSCFALWTAQERMIHLFLAFQLPLQMTNKFLYRTQE